MPNLSTGTIVQVTLEGRLFAQTTLTVLHYRLDATGGPTDMDLLFDQFRTALTVGTTNFYESYIECLSADYVPSYITMQAIYPIRYRARIYTPIQVSGLVAGDSMPPGVQVSITKQSALAQRDGIGGVRMPAVPISFVIEGQISPSAEDAYTIFANNLNNAYVAGAGNTFTPVIFHRLNPDNSLVIATAIVQRTVRTISRRVVGRGI